MIQRAAELSVLGLDGMTLLRTRDTVERLVLTAIADKLAGLRELERQALAAEIIDRLAKSIK